MRRKRRAVICLTGVRRCQDLIHFRRVVAGHKAVDYLPIGGLPQQLISAPRPARYVALMGADCPELKPDLTLEEVDAVKLGETLFSDRRTGIAYTTPAGGCRET